MSTCAWGDEQHFVFGRPIRRPAAFAALSPSELASVEALLSGQSRAQIAESRQTTLRTVANQLSAAYRKLKVSGSTELRALVQNVRPTEDDPQAIQSAMRACEEAVVESIYGNIELPSEQWLSAIRIAAEKAFRGHFGPAQVFELQVDPDGSHHLYGLAASEPYRTSFLAMHRVSPKSLVRALYSAGPVVALETILEGRAPQPLIDWLQYTNTLSVIGVVGMDETGYTVGISWVREPRKRLTRPLHASLRRIAAHVRSAAQIRKGTKSQYAAISQAKMENWERAENDEVKPPPPGSWESWLDGAWSLVDAYDSDGQRLYVARRNDPSERAQRALTASERAVVEIAARGEAHKAIAIELDMKLSTASGTLKRALQKLGAADRQRLIDVYSAIVPDPAEIRA